MAKPQFLLYAIIFSLLVYSQVQVEATVYGFTIDLIHRDSPLSPFYNHSETPSELVNKAFQRSISRAKHFQNALFDQKAIESPLVQHNGDYLMKITMGTPATETYAYADTGSDLVWVKCLPCQQCHGQDVRIFNSTKSSTFKPISCNSDYCRALGSDGSCGSSNECHYRYSYLDKTFTTGTVATETLSFGATDAQVASFPNFVFGCGSNNGGSIVNDPGTAGMVGLGRGTLSLFSQLKPKVGNKFSYCLVPSSRNSHGKLKFGNEATITGNEVVSTPIIFSISNPTFYYLTLEGITLGDRNIPSRQNQGNIIIDSGTTLTYLEQNFYSNFEAAIKEAVGLEPVQSPSETFLLCYGRESVHIPDMVFHFTGADLKLSSENIFMSFNGMSCLAILPSQGGSMTSIFGNYAQANFQVEYDLDAGKVSFAQADCANL